MHDTTVAITTNSEDDFVFKDDGILRGICIDIWERIAYNLNVANFRPAVRSWDDMTATFRSQSADIIVQRMDDGRMRRANISK